MFWKRYGVLLTLLPVAIAIRVFASFPEAVENYYSQGVYPSIASTMRLLLGWIPFSIGDIVYALAVIFLIRGISRFIKRLVQRRLDAAWWRRSAKLTVLVALWIYVVFNLLWGLNYNRIGIAKLLQLDTRPYTVEELQAVVDLTIKKMETCDSSALVVRNDFYKKRVLFQKSIESYEAVRLQHPFLEYNRKSIKPSLFSYLGNYLGYSGYYNPFTGEAQVNTAAPIILQPFVSNHEIGHQLGFARENEANFAGFLASRSSQDPMVRYSIYFDLYIYAARNLARKDSTLAKEMAKKLPPLVKQDIRNLRRFYARYDNPFEPVIRLLYGHYLRANEQPQGILSYDEVIGFVVAYYRKYGDI